MTNKHRTKTKAAMMKQLGILGLLIGAVLVNGSPMVCQKRKGETIYKREKQLDCTSTKDAWPVKIKLEVPNYKQATAPAQWVGMYEATCETHYFFWGSYTHNTWTKPIAITSDQAGDIMAGRCPSLSHPIPYLHHPPASCVYTWPHETDTVITYCLTRPTLIRKSHHHPITSDEETLDHTRIGENYAFTITGALVTWDKSALNEQKKEYVTKYTGEALVQPITDSKITVIIERYQESFIAKSTQDYQGTEQLWNTQEGFRLWMKQSPRRLRPLPRMKRDQEEVQEAIVNEVNAKLNYNTATLETYLERFQKVCYRHNMLQQIIDRVLQSEPDLYVQTLLNNTYITSSVSTNYLIVWPCKPIDLWGVLSSPPGICSQDIPVWYLLDTTNYTGYLDPRNNKIINKTNLIACDGFHHQLLEINEELKVWTGKNLQTIISDNVTQINVVTQSQQIAPVWSNRWIYSPEDFHVEELRYSTWRDVETQYAAVQNRNPEESYNQYIRVPFVGMPLIPSFTRILELIAMSGGAHYLLSRVWSWIRGRARSVPVKNYHETFPLN